MWKCGSNTGNHSRKSNTWHVLSGCSKQMEAINQEINIKAPGQENVMYVI